MTHSRKDRGISKIHQDKQRVRTHEAAGNDRYMGCSLFRGLFTKEIFIYWLILVIIDSMIRNCRHPRVGRACLATQECGGKGGICFELGRSLLRVLQRCFLSWLAQSGMVFRAGAYREDLPRGGVSTNLCVNISCEACKHFLLAIKTQKCTNELNMVFEVNVEKI